MKVREFTLTISSKDLNHLLTLAYSAGCENIDSVEGKRLVNDALNTLIEVGNITVTEYTKPQE